MDVINTLFYYIAKAIAKNYFLIFVLILFSFILTFTVIKCSYFNHNSKRNITLKGKRLMLCGVWFIPFCAILIPFGKYLIHHIGSSSKHAWIATVLKILPIFYVMIILLFIFLGIFVVSVERKKLGINISKEKKKDDITNIID